MHISRYSKQMVSPVTYRRACMLIQYIAAGLTCVNSADSIWLATALAHTNAYSLACRQGRNAQQSSRSTHASTLRSTCKLGRHTIVQNAWR
jgi:hypothetical protein